jgi:hypothetical protein
MFWIAIGYGLSWELLNSSQAFNFCPSSKKGVFVFIHIFLWAGPSLDLRSDFRDLHVCFKFLTNWRPSTGNLHSQKKICMPSEIITSKIFLALWVYWQIFLYLPSRSLKRVWVEDGDYLLLLNNLYLEKPFKKGLHTDSKPALYPAFNSNKNYPIYAQIELTTKY